MSASLALANDVLTSRMTENLLFTGDVGLAGRPAWALTAKQACQNFAEEATVAARGAVPDSAVAGQALMVVVVAAKEQLAVQRPAAVHAEQPCAAAVHVGRAVHAEPAVHAGPAAHAEPAGHVAAAEEVAAVHTGHVAAAGEVAAVHAAHDAENPAAVAAVLPGSKEVPAARAFAADAEDSGARGAGQGPAWVGSVCHTWGERCCDTSLFRQEGSC